MYFNDEQFFYSENISLKKKAMVMKIESDWKANKAHYFYGRNSDINKIELLTNNIVKIFTKISTNIIYKFFNRQNFDYLDSFLKDAMGKTLHEKLNEQWTEDTHYPKYQNTLDKYMGILSSFSDLSIGLQSPYSGEYKEDIENVKNLLIEFNETIFGNVSDIMEKNTTPNREDFYFKDLKDPEFQELIKVAGEITEEELKSKFDKSNKEEYFESVRNANLTRVIVEVLATEFIPRTKNRIEINFWGKEFTSSLQLKQMKMEPYNDAENLKNVRQLAVIFGQLPVDPELDRPPENKNVDFLNVVNDGRLLI
jgi:hypothetical protein